LIPKINKIEVSFYWGGKVMDVKEIGAKLLEIKDYVSHVLWDKLIANHIFLGAVGLIFIISIIKGWEKIALLIFSVSSIIAATHFLLPEEFEMATVPEIVSFIGSIVLIGFIVVYFLFIRSD
jgi:hypothetical protein